MKRKRARLYEYEPDTTELIIGYVSTFVEVPKNDKRKIDQIGFVRKNERNIGRIKKVNKARKWTQKKI